MLKTATLKKQATRKCYFSSPPILLRHFGLNLKTYHHHFYMNLLCKFPFKFNEALIKKTLELLILRHDTLRLRFKQSKKSWKLFYTDFASAREIPIIHCDITNNSVNQQNDIMKRYSDFVCDMNITKGPLIRCVFFENNSNSNYLLITINHIICDAASALTLIKQFNKTYQTLIKKDMPNIKEYDGATCTYVYQKWAQALRKKIKFIDTKSEWEYWLYVMQASTFPYDKVCRAPLHEDMARIKYNISTLTERKQLLNLPHY